MRLTRRLVRLERRLRAVVADDFPTCIAYIPCNGRGDAPPGGRLFRSGPGLVVDSDPACPSQEVSDAWLGEQVPPS
jgi:hypothetical protein